MAKNDHCESEKTVAFLSDTFHRKIIEAGKTPPTLVVLIGPEGYVGKQWPLLEAETIVGRSVKCNVFIDDKSLSRDHARFTIVGSEVLAIDMGSINKTVVNGITLAPRTPHLLKNNDQIKTGNVVFKFHEKGSIEAMFSQELQDRTTKDALTGAFTRAGLLMRGPELIRRSETLNEPLSIVVFDIDLFKKINDSYGHAVGDYVLREIGRIVGSTLVRSNDYFVRYGGEEFVIVLSGSTAKTAIEIAERIRITVQTHSFQQEGRLIPVTVSLGVAERHPSEKSWETLFDRADKALYFSKHNGRNRATLSN